MPTDVLIIGAGVAGLSAAIDLARAGVRVEILEARDRVGGRILTVHDPALNYAVDLGAEFVHGLAPEIWGPVQQHKLQITEVEGDPWCSIEGKIQPCNFFAQADTILQAMNDQGPDQSFLEFLARYFPGDEQKEAKRWATNYVSGFNAADPALVSVHWLVHSRKADEQIEGDRAFRIAGGYQRFLDTLIDELKRLNVRIHLNATARAVEWNSGAAQIHALESDGETQLSAAKVLVTVPPGILRSEAVRFVPQLLPEKEMALEKLAMGKVVRVVLCFRERFWERLRGTPDSRSLRDMGFVFSRDEFFPTWWTKMPEPVPIITGWAAAQSAERLSGLDKDEIVGRAVESLSSILHVEHSLVRRELSAAYFHDWDSDPFSQGAYSYVKAGGEGCQKTLGQPVGNTLFFAGEATDTSGHNGTVHGAIASGKRAAAEMVRARDGVSRLQ